MEGRLSSWSVWTAAPRGQLRPEEVIDTAGAELAEDSEQQAPVDRQTAQEQDDPTATATSGGAPGQLLTDSRVAHRWSAAPGKELWPVPLHSPFNVQSPLWADTVTHCPRPGRAATNGCGNSLLSPPPLHTPLSSQTVLLLADQQATSLLDSLVAGGREEAGREGRARALHTLQVTGSGDGTGQRPPVTPSLAGRPSRCFLQWKVAGQGAQWGRGEKVPWNLKSEVQTARDFLETLSPR